MLGTDKFGIVGEAELILLVELPEKAKGHTLQNAEVKC